MRRTVAFAAVPLAALTLTACSSVPENASVKDFCAEGEKFSASTNFPDGVKAAKRLQEVGTPPGIGASARTGFVELVDRVLDSENGGDFRARTKKLTAEERKHLVALSNYIRKTCELD